MGLKAFKALLTSATSDDQLTSLGELLYQVRYHLVLFLLCFLLLFSSHNKNGELVMGGAQCHYSYSACGLGSDGTDRLVQLVQDMQHSKLSKSEDGTLYGAKITGGGSGGTVCVMGRNSLGSSHQIIEVSNFFLFFHFSLLFKITTLRF